MIGSRFLRYALALSLSVNLGVIGALGYRAIEAGRLPGTGESFPGLVRYLDLSDAQQRHWHDAESDFLANFEARAAEIHERRDRLIREVFADEPDHAAIEAERARIARLQDEQQRVVIDQLLRERALLDKAQRERLVQLLLDQPVGAPGFETLHRD